MLANKLAKMKVISLITLPIYTNYTTIYRGHGAKNAAVTKRNERNVTNEK